MKKINFGEEVNARSISQSREIGADTAGDLESHWQVCLIFVLSRRFLNPCNEPGLLIRIIPLINHVTFCVDATDA